MDPEIPWKSIAGFRDVVIHQYFRVDLDSVWDIAANLAPGLTDRLKAVLRVVEEMEPGP